jgi:putative SOS response-associated peptidase YedK
MHPDRPFAFAGIWTARKIGDDEWEKSLAIITADASPTLKRIHNRMPVVLHPANYSVWLDPGTEHPAELARPFDSGALEAYPTSTYVNDPKNDSAEAVRRSVGGVQDYSDDRSRASSDMGQPRCGLIRVLECGPAAYR